MWRGGYGTALGEGLEARFSHVVRLRDALLHLDLLLLALVLLADLLLLRLDHAQLLDVELLIGLELDLGGLLLGLLVDELDHLLGAAQRAERPSAGERRPTGGGGSARRGKP